MWHRPHRGHAHRLAARHGPHAVAAAHERRPLDHRHDRRMHAPGGERVHRPLAGGPLAPGGLGGDPARLAQQAQEAGLELGERQVRARDREDGLFGVEQAPLGQALDVDVAALEQPDDLVQAGQHGPRPPLGQGGRPDLGGHRGVAAERPDDVPGPQERHVGDLAGPDVVRGRDVEGGRRRHQAPTPADLDLTWRPWWRWPAGGEHRRPRTSSGR